jgi:hypothetical protein
MLQYGFLQVSGVGPLVADSVFGWRSGDAVVAKT